MPVAGWSVADIVRQVNGRTEGRATKKGDFDILKEFFFGLDEFCQEKHYWWRNKLFSFQTQIDVKAYDLSSNATGQAAAPDAVEIEEAFVINGNPQQYPYSVNPMFSPRDQVAAIFGNQSVQGQFPKSGYFLDGFQNFVLGAAPTEIYTIAATYWAVPMVTDTTVQVIPLVPPNLHFGLIYMLERRVYEYLYGQNDPRFVTSNKRYDDFVITASKNESFSSQEAISARTNMPAVTSSGGRGWRGGVRGQGR